MFHPLSFLLSLQILALLPSYPLSILPSFPSSLSSFFPSFSLLSFLALCMPPFFLPPFLLVFLASSLSLSLCVQHYINLPSAQSKTHISSSLCTLSLSPSPNKDPHRPALCNIAQTPNPLQTHFGRPHQSLERQSRTMVRIAQLEEWPATTSLQGVWSGRMEEGRGGAGAGRGMLWLRLPCTQGKNHASCKAALTTHVGPFTLLTCEDPSPNKTLAT